MVEHWGAEGAGRAGGVCGALGGGFEGFGVRGSEDAAGVGGSV